MRLNNDTINLETAELTIQQCMANEHPEWVESNGECQACVSISHELADPYCIPGDLLA